MRYILACLPVIVCASPALAQTNPSTSFPVNGSVATRCALGTTPITPTVTVNGNGGTGMLPDIVANSPSSWSIPASCSGPSSLSVTARSLRLNTATATVANQRSQTINYTATASGWTSTAATVLTADTAAGSATYSITGTARSRANAGSGNISVTFGGYSIPSNGTNTKLLNGTYSSVITLTLSPAN